MGLPLFGFVCLHRRPLADGIAREADLMAGCAATGRAAAHLWQAPEGLVVPRRCTSLPGWQAARDSCRVEVRASGGGPVPQGPGVWNLSLAWPAPSAQPVDTGAIYAALCSELAAAFARLGIAAAPQPVSGSFCDGRYNLAAAGRKLAGTAQAWRRIDGRPVVLAHAVFVVDADPQALAARANRFETLLGSGQPYRADSLTSVALEAPDPADIESRTLQVLAEQFARVLPPRVLTEVTDGPA